MGRPRARVWPWLATAWSLLAGEPVAVAHDDDGLSFVRVNVSAAALADVPLAGGRYVPMPLEEFDDAVARLGPMGRRFRVGLAAEAEYELSSDAAGVVTGVLTFRVGDAAVALPGYVPLGRVTVERCTVRTAEGTGEAAVFSLPDGTAAVRTPGPGTYSCDVRLPGSESAAAVRLPLVPALVTTVDLRLPESARPIVIGPDAPATVVEPVPDEADRWRILRGPVGPGAELAFLVHAGSGGSPAVRAWNCLTIRGREAEVVARLEPMAEWTPDPLILSSPAGMRITDVVSPTDDLALPWSAEGDRLMIEIPGRLAGTRSGIIVRGVAAAAADELQRLPVLEPVVSRWAGCNTRLALDPSLALLRLVLDESRVVSPTTAARWPLPAVELPAATAGVEPAVVFIEHEAPAAEVRGSIAPRAASLDTARATTIDILPGTVLGRTAADIRVVAGQVFELTADVASGWFIDSVETVDWTAGRADGASGVPTGTPPEWRVVRSPRGSELRIGLPLAATPRRGLGLLINGHRAGLPLGAEFSSDDMDMVRFPGELAVLEFQLSPNVVLEAAGGSLGLEPVGQRLEPLVALTAPRARIAAGERAPAARARLVRRRPPVEAEVAVDLVARDDRLAETFTFTCQPVAGELDAVVVHFSQPMAPGLEWSLADGGTGSLAAQLLDPDDATRGELRTDAAVAESWLVELRPATAAAARFRATRTVPLAEGVAVPLAWVEAAERPGGVVTVRGEPGRRPNVANRQLREVPPLADADPGVLTFAYASPRSLDAGEPVAEVVGPAAHEAPRAWAWRQLTTCWCFESGALEWETTFDIENQGRESATITLPEGLRVEGVTVAGEAVAAAAIGPDMVGLSVPLPQTASRISLVIRGSGSRPSRPSRLGWWRLGGVACGIDMPVLDPQVTLMLPPGLELVGTTGAAEPRSWTARLAGTSGGPTADGGPARVGFRGIPLAATVGGSPSLVRTEAVASLAILMGAFAAIGGFAIARRSGPGVIAVCGLAACVALWIASPWDAPARAVLWGGIAGGWLGSRRPAAGRWTASLVVTACMLAAGAATAAEPPLRVYVTPGDAGGTALVPERLFRRLSAAAAGAGPPTVRVLASELDAEIERGVWRVRFELDADQGGGLLLDQRATGATWAPPADPPPGLAVTLSADGRVARVTASAAGRHELMLRLTPSVVRTGDVEAVTIGLPPAPRARLRLVEPEDGAAAWQCDRSIDGGPWLSVPSADGGFDLAGAARVRLVRAVDPRAVLLATPRAAVSFNDIVWQQDGSRLTATFDVGGERQIVRSLVIRADPLLQPVVTPGGEPPPRSLGEGRWIVELAAPRIGQRRFVIEFLMPLADPVGIFDAPFAWLAGAEVDVRTVRLRPAADLEVAPELPTGISLVKPRDEDGLATTAVWRSDAVAAPGSVGAAGEPRARIVVRRREPQPAVSQDLAVDFVEDHVGLLLRCRLDTGAEPILEIPLVVPPAAVIDGVSLTREPAGEAAAGPPQRMDLNWSREAADRIVAVVQRPEAGRFVLQLDARLPIRPARRGRLPIARIALDTVPLEVSCRTAAGMGISLDPNGSESVAVATAELGPGEPAPAYVLSRDPPRRGDVDESPDEPRRQARADRTTATTTIDLAIDGLGRAWGLARFDVVAFDPSVRLVLPAGLRLFDVRVDGREVTAVPADGNAWDVRLHDVSWPRSLVAVMAGSLGGRLADGGAIRLEPPRLEGAATGTVLWTVAIPPGFEVRVSEPARVLDAAAVAEVQGSLRDGMAEMFREAIRSVGRRQREQLEGFASSRREVGGPAGERTWYEAWRGSAGSGPERTSIAPDDDGGVTIRAVRVGDSAVATRGLITAAILGAVFASWLVARRFPVAAGHAAAVARRWWWLACGGLWVMTLEPRLPGVLMLCVGAWVAWRRDGAAQAGVDHAAPAAESTRSFTVD